MNKLQKEPELKEPSVDKLVMATCKSCENYTTILAYDRLCGICIRFTFEPSINGICEFFESELEVNDKQE